MAALDMGKDTMAEAASLEQQSDNPSKEQTSQG
jgi:hypothetical protein